MADFLLQFIQWAIPSGGIGAAIVWFANRKANNAKNAKVVHDTYKVYVRRHFKGAVGNTTEI